MSDRNSKLNEIIHCDRCGCQLTLRGRNRHASSDACDAIRAEAELLELGFARAGKHVKRLRTLGVELRYALGVQRDGLRRRRARRNVYAPAYVVAAFNCVPRAQRAELEEAIRLGERGRQQVERMTTFYQLAKQLPAHGVH